jgi:hypothetical protein
LTNYEEDIYVSYLNWLIGVQGEKQAMQFVLCLLFPCRKVNMIYELVILYKTMNFSTCSLCEKDVHKTDESGICNTCLDYGYEIKCETSDCCGDKNVISHAFPFWEDNEPLFAHLFNKYLNTFSEDDGLIWWKIAAIHGNLPVINWLWRNNMKGFTLDIVRLASENGHREVAIWLCEVIKKDDLCWL